MFCETSFRQNQSKMLPISKTDAQLGGQFPTDDPKLALSLILASTALASVLATLAQVLWADEASLPGHTLLWAFVLFSLINYSLYRDVLHPACMFSFIWLFSTAFYVWFPGEIDSLHWLTVLILTGGTASFSIGCWFGSRPLCAGRPRFTRSAGNPKTRILLLIYCVAIIPFSVYATMQLAGIFGLSPAMFLAARQTVINLQATGSTVESNPLVSMAPTIAVSTAFLMLIEERKRRFAAISIAAALVLGLFTTGRAIWMLLFCGWVIIRLLQSPTRSLASVGRRMAVVSLSILIALTIPALLTKTETQSAGASGLEIAARMTAVYIGGPLAGFNYVVEHPGTFSDQSNNTFAEVLTPLRTIGLRYVPPPHFEPFFPVPFMINVFTAYKSFYVDFGPIGTFVSFMICGAICALIFAAAHRGNKFAMFVFCYAGFAIIFSPFLNSFILFYRYSYILFFGAIYFILIPRLPILTVLGKRYSVPEH